MFVVVWLLSQLDQPSSVQSLTLACLCLFGSKRCPHLSNALDVILSLSPSIALNPHLQQALLQLTS